MRKPRYIAHTGGKQPVADDVMVEVLLKIMGSTVLDPEKASFWYWNIDNDPGDIIAYRVIK